MANNIPTDKQRDAWWQEIGRKIPGIERGSVIRGIYDNEIYAWLLTTCANGEEDEK